MHARCSLMALAAVLFGTAAIAQVPPLSIPLVGLVSQLPFSAWNPATSGSQYVFTNNNLTASATWPANGGAIARVTTSKSSGKWYFEVTHTTVATQGGADVGIANASAAIANELGSDNNSYGYYSGNPSGGVAGLYHGGSTPVVSTTGYGSGAIISIALDMDHLKIYWAVNGVWQASGNPAAGTGGYAITAGSWFAAADGGAWPNGSESSAFTLNVGKTAFSYAIPTGFAAWH